MDAWCRVAEVKGSGVVVERKGSRPRRTASQSAIGLARAQSDCLDRHRISTMLEVGAVGRKDVTTLAIDGNHGEPDQIEQMQG